MARGSLYPDDQDVKNQPKIAGRRGSLVWHPWRGRLVVQSLPRYTSPNSLRALQRWIAWLRVQNILFLYMSAKVRIEFMRQERLSGIPARDWFMSQARGLTWSYWIPGYGEVFSMAHVERYSRSLDVFGQRLGDILVRGGAYWESLSAGLDGQVLTIRDGRPVWDDLGGSGAVSASYPAEAMYPYGTSLVTLYSTIRAVRLPYLTEGSGNVFVPVRDRLPTVVRGWYGVPGTGNGNMLLYAKAMAVMPVGEPVPLQRVDALVPVYGGQFVSFSHVFQLPELPSGTVGLSLGLGRAGQESSDTFGDYAYLLSMSVE